MAGGVKKHGREKGKNKATAKVRKSLDHKARNIARRQADGKRRAAKWARRHAAGLPLKGQKRRNARRSAGHNGYRTGRNA